MGGCRCIFRNCAVNSSSYPGMHFFHFPVKQKDKLDLWVKYAKAEHILNLTPSQMKNKVVCNTHFRDECFMNYKKDRLTREAVPTIMRLAQTNMVFDYEVSDNPRPTKLPVTTAKHLLPPGMLADDKLEDEMSEAFVIDTDLCSKSDQTIENSTNTEENIISMIAKELKELQELNSIQTEEVETVSTKNSSDTEQPPKKHTKFTSPPKILNRNAGPTMQKSKSPGKKSSPTVIPRRKTILLNGSKTAKIYRNPKKAMRRINSINDKSISNEYSSPFIDLFKINDDNVPILIDKTEIFTEKKSNDIWEIQKLEYEQKIQELQDKLQKKEDEISKVTQIETVSTSKQILQHPPNFQPKQLTKNQLFNGIKKYLCPSMSSLVRMEMFSEPEREWKPDEKQASIELLQLGDAVFDYFRDEWRFRLPPKKDVEQWMAVNTNVNDDEDL